MVIGLLCDEQGEPVSSEVFRGNTQDTATFGSQVKKASQRFAGERVTLVGDRGMIQSGQIEDLSKTGFHYITAITKPQIETLLQTGLLQMAWFDDTLCEVEHDRVRYILRRNPRRAEELVASRADKQASARRTASTTQSLSERTPTGQSGHRGEGGPGQDRATETGALAASRGEGRNPRRDAKRTRTR